MARCTAERLMRFQGLRGMVLGKVVRTSVSDAKANCQLDRVNRIFKADRPNPLWVSDFTNVSTWHGCFYLAFVRDSLAQALTRASQRAKKAWPKPALSLRWAAKETAMTKLWPRRSMARTKPSSFTVRGSGNPRCMLSGRRRIGCLGSTITDCSRPSATYPQHKLRRTNRGNSSVKPPWQPPDIHQIAYKIPGAIHSIISLSAYIYLLLYRLTLIPNNHAKILKRLGKIREWYRDIFIFKNYIKNTLNIFLNINL